MIAEARTQPLDFGLGVDCAELAALGEVAEVGVEVMALGPAPRRRLVSNNGHAFCR
jgi:hypothetical protein